MTTPRLPMADRHCASWSRAKSGPAKPVHEGGGMTPDASVQELKAEIAQIDRQIEQERKRHAEAGSRNTRSTASGRICAGATRQMYGTRAHPQPAILNGGGGLRRRDNHRSATDGRKVMRISCRHKKQSLSRYRSRLPARHTSRYWPRSRLLHT